MKKITALLLSLTMIASLSACGEKKEETASTTEATTVTTKATTKATTKETVPETTENVYELNYTYKFDDCVSIKINKNWEMDEKENISSFYIPINNGLVIAKSTFEDFSDSTLLLFAEELKSNGDIEDYKFIEIDEHNAITYENLGENTITYQFAVDTTVYNILLGNSLDSNLIDSMLNSIQILETNVAETEKITNKKTEVKKDDEDVSLGKLNALESAKSYIEYGEFSYNGLIGQLEYEQYSSEEAKYGADNCGADWNEEALESAKSYIEYSDFSYSGLYDQLIYEEFTDEQAQYGVDNCKADWMEEAAECAQSYIDYSSFSRQELYDQLIYEGFTEEQAEYGVTAVGY